jgi:ABC-type branched-subunit amino acid transport system ATPase component
MDVGFSIWDTIAALHHGSIIAAGPPDEAQRHDEVRRVYLGGAP